MKVAVEVAVVVVVDVGSVVAVVELVVDLIEIQSAMRTPMVFLVATDHLKREMGKLLKDAGAMVRLVVPSVVGVVVVTRMVRMVKGNALGGFLIVTVVQDVGVILSVKGLDGGIGEHPLMTLLRRLRSLALKLRRMLVLRSSRERMRLQMPIRIAL